MDGLLESSEQTITREPNSATVEALRSITAYTFATVMPNDETAIRVCTDIGIIPDRSVDSPPPCPKCQTLMKARKSRDNKAGFIYVCQKNEREEITISDGSKRLCVTKKCNGYLSPFKNTFFENINVTVLKVLRLMYAWVIKMPVTMTFHECCVANRTAIDFFGLFRHVAEVVISHLQIKIGGPGKTVEVDETYIRRRKRNRGKLTDVQIIAIMGVYCHETKEGLFWQIPNKTRRVPWSFMYNYIAEGSKIVTDYAPHYRKCENSGLSFQKITNHRKKDVDRFTDSEDSSDDMQMHDTRNKHSKVYTIERGRIDNSLHPNIAERTYRLRVLGAHKTNGSKFVQFLNDVRRIYPGPGKTGLKLKMIEILSEEQMDEPYIDVAQIAAAFVPNGDDSDEST